MGRSVFYNNSTFDGNDPAATPTDDAAIATDKSALLPNGVAQFSNFTSYAKGLNGLMVDLAARRGCLRRRISILRWGTMRRDRNGRRVGRHRCRSGRIRRARGVTRVEFTWADNAIVNEWLRVTVKSDAATGLAAPDVFYFGNLIGASGLAALGGLFVVSGADSAAAQADPHGPADPRR